MQKVILLLTILLFSVSTLLLAAEKPAVQTAQGAQKEVRTEPYSDIPTISPIKPLSTKGYEFEGGIIFWEDFEPGGIWHRWTGVDNTFPPPERGPSQWVVDTLAALGDSSWRCADLTLGTNGGYGNHWYQVLDTPPIMVTDTNAVFSFYHRFSMEGAAGAPSPYDGWDGANVRISTDNGQTWQVLPYASYTVTSSWAFGHPAQGHAEGVGIPSWAGDQLQWVKESIALKEYLIEDQPLMFRFAFASDLAYSTEDDAPDMFGWQLDSILVSAPDTIFFANYGERKDMTGMDLEFIPPVGGNLWHVVRFNEPLPHFPEHDPPSGIYAAACQNSGEEYDPLATYNPWMDNIYVAGPIALPDVEPIYLDFQHMPYFTDPDPFPDLEFFRPEVRHIDSTSWEFIEEQPYVYYSNIYDFYGIEEPVWMEFAAAWGWPTNLSQFDLSRFAGQDIYISFRFWSDEDQPLGPGLLIDDVVIYSPIKQPDPPANVTAEPVPADTSVVVQWDFEEGIIYTVWRAKPGDASFFFRGEVRDSVFVDKGSDVEPFIEYLYVVTSSVKYEGRSDLSDVASATIIPLNVIEFGYSDGSREDYLTSDANRRVAVKITPPVYPVDLTHVLINVDTSGVRGTAARFTVTEVDTNGLPGTVITTRNFTGLKDGFNTVALTTPVSIDTGGSVFVTYQRFSTSPYVAVDTDAPIAGNTLLETADGWIDTLQVNAIMHVYLDTTEAIPPVGLEPLRARIADGFILGSNYPNPFNPQTTIPFVIPAQAAGQRVKLEVYNILGQKVATLFDEIAPAGTYQVQWNALNEAGKAVGSGIYLYQLSSDKITLTQRMLLLK